MASQYTIEMNYIASIVIDVEANDEGEALTKARELAEMAPMSNFALTSEENARIINVTPLRQ